MMTYGRDGWQYVMVILPSCSYPLYIHQNNLNHKKWRPKPFPLYDEILPFVKNRHANGSSVFHHQGQVAANQSPELEGDNDKDIDGGTALDHSGDDFSDEELSAV